MRHILKAFVAALALGATAPVPAALHARAGGAAYYDDVLDITWLGNPNLADTTSFGVAGISDGNGNMDYDLAQQWLAAMNAANFLGVSTWRFPVVIDTGDPGCDQDFTGLTDCGWYTTSTGEMAHLFYATLGNIGNYDTAGVPTGCGGAGNPCLVNRGPFFFLPTLLWNYGTKDASNPARNWVINFQGGKQETLGSATARKWWPVADGDVVAGPATDTDGDGVADIVDNCRLVANPTQCDSNQDGFGNHCDGDLTNQSPYAVNAQDTSLFRQQLGQPSIAPAYNPADLNCNGAVNSQDTVRFRSLLGLTAGPSGFTN